VKLSPEDVAKLHDKELANYIRKLQSGKMLTRDERRLLEEARAGTAPQDFQTVGKFTANWDELSRALGITRRGLQKVRDRFPAHQPRDQPPSHPDADPPAGRPRCGGRRSNFLANRQDA